MMPVPSMSRNKIISLPLIQLHLPCFFSSSANLVGRSLSAVLRKCRRKNRSDFSLSVFVISLPFRSLIFGKLMKQSPIINNLHDIVKENDKCIDYLEPRPTVNCRTHCVYIRSINAAILQKSFMLSGG